MLKNDTAVLIITERYDVRGHALNWALNRAGVRCDRWSLSEFPEGQLTSVRISNSLAPPSFRIPGLSDNYQSIWLRRLAEPSHLSIACSRGCPDGQPSGSAQLRGDSIHLLPTVGLDQSAALSRRRQRQAGATSRCSQGRTENPRDAHIERSGRDSANPPRARKRGCLPPLFVTFHVERAAGRSTFACSATARLTETTADLFAEESLRKGGDL